MKLVIVLLFVASGAGIGFYLPLHFAAQDESGWGAGIVALVFGMPIGASVGLIVGLVCVEWLGSPRDRDGDSQ